MADGLITIKEDASPTKNLGSQTHLHGVDTVHAEEIVIVDAAGNIVGATANRLNVDGSGVTQPVSDAGGSLTVDALDLDIRNLGAADVPDLSDRAGRLLGQVEGRAADGAAVAGNPVRIAGKDGGGLTQDIATDTSGELQVDVLTLPSVTIGTFPDNEPFNVAQYGGTAVVNGGVAGVPSVGGNVAHDGVDAGNPVKIGAKAAGALPTAVAAADRVDLYADREGRQIVRPWGAGEWSQVHLPAVNTRATSTKTAGGAGIRHVCTGLTVILAGDSTAPAATVLDVRLRDGIADTGTILWQAKITLPATAGAMNGISRSGLHIKGSAATAMTLEFSAAGGANTFESVSFEGVDITEA